MAKRRKIHKGLRNKKKAANQVDMPDCVLSSGAKTPAQLEEARKQARSAGIMGTSKRTRIDRTERKYGTHRESDD